MESLSFYDVENAAETIGFDLGTAAPSSSEDYMLRVNNDSDLYQAGDVTVSITGDDAVQLWLSTDGETFGPSVAIGDIPPGGTSDAFWLRRVTASADSAGSCTATLAATSAAWQDPVDTTASTNIALSTQA